MQEVSFEEVLDQVLAKDERYDREAYLFAREALDYTQRLIGRHSPGQIRHVSGQELLEGVRQFALAQFGPMTITVLEAWGVRNCRDFGEIIFNMVEIGLLAKTEKDRRTDFDGGYEFEAAFRDPFLPSNKQRAEPAETKSNIA